MKVKRKKDFYFTRYFTYHEATTGISSFKKLPIRPIWGFGHLKRSGTLIGSTKNLKPF